MDQIIIQLHSGKALCPGGGLTYLYFKTFKYILLLHLHTLFNGFLTSHVHTSMNYIF